MTGSLQVKKEIYYMVLNTYDANGKRKPKWIATGYTAKGNKKRAEQMLRETLREWEQRHSSEKAQMRFSDWVREWLEDTRQRVDIITYEGYSNVARLHVLPHFDALGVTLEDITRPMLQAYVDQKSVTLSASSLQKHRNILNQSCKAALLGDWIQVNPCDGLRLPKQQKPEFSFYTAPQLARLLQAIQGEPLFPLVQVAAVYGLRKSELLGLQWDSVDFEANTLTVKHTVVKLCSTVAKDTPKSNASRRTFPLTPEMRTLFLQAKADETANRRLFGREYHQSPYIFKWPDGRPFSPDYVSQKFSKLLKQHGLPHIRFHELRHSCASMLIAQGFSLKDVQEWLGHADITLTANTYSHLDIARKKSIAESLTGSF